MGITPRAAAGTAPRASARRGGDSVGGAGAWPAGGGERGPRKRAARAAQARHPRASHVHPPFTLVQSGKKWLSPLPTTAVGRGSSTLCCALRGGRIRSQPDVVEEY